MWYGLRYEIGYTILSLAIGLSKLYIAYSVRSSLVPSPGKSQIVYAVGQAIYYFLVRIESGLNPSMSDRYHTS